MQVMIMTKKTKKTIQKLLPVAAVILILAIAYTIKYAVVHFDKKTEEPPIQTAGTSDQTNAPTEPTSENTTKSTSAPPTSEAPVNRSFYSGVAYRSPTAETADIFKHGRNMMLLNKEWELPEDFKWNLVYWANGNPVDAMSLNSSKSDSVKAVDREAYEPLKNMFRDAEAAGVPLQLVSAYRSIDLQDRLFTRSVNAYMKSGLSKEAAIKKANTERTFTGTSEHNTGYGFDILEKGNYTLTAGFENTAQFRWLSEHAEEYGFILRYPKNKTAETGIMYEPWHYRFVGVENAKKINASGLCLEEYIDYIER